MLLPPFHVGVCKIWKGIKLECWHKWNNSRAKRADFGKNKAKTSENRLKSICSANICVSLYHDRK